MKAIFFKLLVCVTFLFSTPLLLAQNLLRNQIASIIQGKKAKIGVAVRFEGQETLTVNNHLSYAMLSTFKFPVALAVLHQLDKKHLPLETGIFVSKSDLRPGTYSPLRRQYPEGDFNMSIKELLRYCISLSDNNACDILIKYLGGTTAIQQYLHQLGIPDITIVATEDLMHQKEENAYLNRIRPSAATDLLEKFLSKTLLRTPYQDFLEQIMLETSTGTDKLKGLLPGTIAVGHKTGSSDRDANGKKIADNDMGFVLLPNGKRYSIAVFVMDSMEDDKTNASIIARISKAVYDYYSKTPD